MDDNTLKMAVIAGASYALKYREKNERASEAEILGKVVKNVNKIIEDIQEN